MKNAFWTSGLSRRHMERTWAICSALSELLTLLVFPLMKMWEQYFAVSYHSLNFLLFYHKKWWKCGDRLQPILGLRNRDSKEYTFYNKQENICTNLAQCCLVSAGSGQAGIRTVSAQLPICPERSVIWACLWNLSGFKCWLKMFFKYCVDNPLQNKKKRQTQL